MGVVEQLDDDFSIRVSLPRQINPAHAAFVKQAENLVLAQKDATHHAAPQKSLAVNETGTAHNFRVRLPVTPIFRVLSSKRQRLA
jgi:hypothetical protein